MRPRPLRNGIFSQFYRMVTGKNKKKEKMYIPIDLERDILL